MSGFIRIRGQEFSVQEATVDAKIAEIDRAEIYWGQNTNGISWAFEIQGIDRENEENNEWRPRIYCQNFLLQVNHWSQLTGQRFEWFGRPDEYGQNTTTVLEWGHNDVPRSIVTFGERRGNQFDFRLEGFGEEHGEKFSLLVETIITFIGVSVEGPDVESATERLNQHFNSDEFNTVPPYPNPSKFVKFELKPKFKCS